jgi:prophage regulatory protein
MNNDKLLRLKQVLERVPVSKSSFWNGVRTGKYPKPLKLGPRTSAWRESEIDRIVREGV